MISHFILVSISFLLMGKKRTVSVLLSLEIIFFRLILLYSFLSDLGLFFIVMCIIVTSATFSLSLFVKSLGIYSSDSQQVFLEWGNSICCTGNLHLPSFFLPFQFVERFPEEDKVLRQLFFWFYALYFSFHLLHL